MGKPSYYTIPPGCAFANDLAKGLLETSSTPQDLAKTQIYLPTRRAVRALSAAFVAQSDGRALLLPRMIALGDIDDDGHDPLLIAEDGHLPPAISDMRRLCLIAAQVKSFPIGGQRPSEAQAFALARALVRVFDQIQNAQFDISQLQSLWPAELASHWHDIAQFLSILWKFWPHILESEGAMDPVARRIAMMERQAQAWRDHPPEEQIILAGSTGTLPATRMMMKVVASLPHGKVIFPGMTPDITDDDWQAICEDQVHPLHPLSLTLADLSLMPFEIAIWPSCRVSHHQEQRRLFLQEVMRPASQTDKWRSLAHTASSLTQSSSYGGFRRLEAQDAYQEAEIVALLMRQTLEVPQRTAILVTADRQLAAMVQSELRRFGIDIDDSAGAPLSQSATGSFLYLLSRLMCSDDMIADLLALCAHPFASGQMGRVAFREQINHLNQAHLRGALHFDDLVGLTAHLDDDNALKAFMKTNILGVLSPLWAGQKKPTRSLRQSAVLLGEVAENFAATGPDDKAEAIGRLWSGPEGQAAAKLLQDFAAHGGDFTHEVDAFPEILQQMMQNIEVRQPYQKQSRLAILGAVESRMLHADLVILSGLNEGVWPPRAAQDVFMNQAMANEIGLPHRQWRVALSAHDFMMAASMQEVVITRARRQNDVITLPSRWLTRMDAVMTALKIEDLIAPKIPDDINAILTLRKNRPVAPILPPHPCPPLSQRPTSFSATQFDQLINDPYAIYAKKVLGLRALAPVNEAPNVALKGTLFHKVLQEFITAYPEGKIGAQERAHIMTIAERLFAPWLSHYEVKHFWWPQLQAVINWFMEADSDLRQEGDMSFAEVSGKVQFTIGERQFSVVAKADRLVRHDDGTVSVIDYKTGASPSKKSVKGGRSTQMLVEAALLHEGGYEAIAQKGTIVKALEYWQLSGRGARPGKRDDVTPKEFDETNLFSAITSLIARFEMPETPYHAEPDPRGRLNYSDYRHLARIKEWRVLEVVND